MLFFSVVPPEAEALSAFPAHFLWEEGGKMKKVKACKEWKREVSLSGAFMLVDSINEYARQRNSVLAGHLD